MNVNPYSRYTSAFHGAAGHRWVRAALVFTVVTALSGLAYAAVALFAAIAVAEPPTNLRPSLPAMAVLLARSILAGYAARLIADQRWRGAALAAAIFSLSLIASIASDGSGLKLSQFYYACGMLACIRATWILRRRVAFAGG